MRLSSLSEPAFVLPFTRLLSHSVAPASRGLRPRPYPVSPAQLRQLFSRRWASASSTAISARIEPESLDIDRFTEDFVEKTDAASATRLVIVDAGTVEAWKAKQSEVVQQLIATANFSGKEAGKFAVIPDLATGKMDFVVCSTGESSKKPVLWNFSAFPKALPKGIYQVDNTTSFSAADLTLAWALGSYSFSVFKSKSKKTGATGAQLVHPTSPADPARDRAMSLASATYLVRDLVNFPADDMGPEAIEIRSQAVAARFGAKINVIHGNALLEATNGGFPQVHAVGRAAAPWESRAPRVIDLRWGDEDDPHIVLVGKGVCFDTGGLDIKPAAGMRNMKKDMAGSAQVLGLATMIMRNKLRVNLRVMIAAVENSIAGNAFRPGDVLTARNGLTVEIENTDAEGRLVISDLMAAAAEEHPDMMIDCATLTGAQRVALGAEIAGIFCNRKETANRLMDLGEQVSDPVWELPIFKPYEKLLRSSIADMKNCSTGGLGGAITAALFLEKFIGQCDDWVHVDFMGYNNSSQPGRPEGGEAHGMRALYTLLEERFR
mmetsp:Transcript_10177/g.25542  ORF Transcript_10177/g.25542 Transcript_10177/m.25542 type:complete len:549 (-) Transcript_10177:66-1712(-)|eukprot:CAMPEP_0174896718 /NCGR_PEP_ID=MMETSP0167-20121228/10837_1 /TAXON_ID=38298 /ORGANISM="Rhodella maculata, Strain CCMP736" /LENGTH=548 /DNA_ID=CAMNT_0016136355 /DNA_START=660 /DNA_END=2306 /DNA_ORIENTATION=+